MFGYANCDKLGIYYAWPLGLHTCIVSQDESSGDVQKWWYLWAWVAQWFEGQSSDSLPSKLERCFSAWTKCYLAENQVVIACIIWVCWGCIFVSKCWWGRAASPKSSGLRYARVFIRRQPSTFQVSKNQQKPPARPDKIILAAFWICYCLFDFTFVIWCIGKILPFRKRKMSKIRLENKQLLIISWYWIFWFYVNAKYMCAWSGAIFFLQPHEEEDQNTGHWCKQMLYRYHIGCLAKRIEWISGNYERLVNCETISFVRRLQNKLVRKTRQVLGHHTGDVYLISYVSICHRLQVLQRHPLLQQQRQFKRRLNPNSPSPMSLGFLLHFLDIISKRTQGNDETPIALDVVQQAGAA